MSLLVVMVVKNLSFSPPHKIVDTGFTPFDQHIVIEGPVLPDQSSLLPESLVPENELDDQTETILTEEFLAETDLNVAQINEIEAMAQQLADEKTTALVHTLHSLIGEIEERAEDRLRHIEMSALKLAYLIAQKIIHKETQSSSDVILYQIREMVKHFRKDMDLHIYVSTNDFDFIERQKEFKNWLDAKYPHYQFKVDNELTSGGCRIETDFSIVDATIESQLHQLEIELFQDTE